jgi:two-component system sensor histidine kinase RegB
VIVDPAHLKRSDAGSWNVESDTDARLVGETARHLALRWVVRLRCGFIAGEIALTAALAFGLQISMPPLVLVTVIALQALSNWILSIRKERLGESAEHLVGAFFVLDTLCLTTILGLSGGPANPFSLNA